MAKEKIESSYQKITPVILLIDFISTDIPIDKMYFLDLALKNLTNQNFTQFFISVKQDSYIYEKKIKEYNIKYEILENNDFGDLMREIDNLDYLYEAYIVYPINYNISNVNGLLASYKNSDKKTIMSVYLTGHSDIIVGMDNDAIVFYDTKLRNNFFDMVDKNEKLCVRKSGVPEVVAVGKEFLALYNENYDFMSVFELIETLCLVNLYNYKMIGYSDHPDAKYLRIKTAHEYYSYIMEIKNKALETKETKDIIGESNYRETVDTLYLSENEFEYSDTSEGFETEELTDEMSFGKENDERQIFNNCLIGKNCTISGSVNIRNSVIGSNVKILEGVVIVDSYVESGCTVENSIKSSVLCSNVTNKQELENAILLDDQVYLNAYMFEESMPEDNSVSCEVADSGISFHQDVLSYLDNIASEVIERKLPIEDVKREVNLIAIIWKASQNDLLDVFIIFISGFIKEHDLDQSTIDLMLFFPIIYGLMDNSEKQESFVVEVYNCLRMEKKRNKKEAFVRLGYALMDDGIIDKDVLNNVSIIKGNFFR